MRRGRGRGLAAFAAVVMLLGATPAVGASPAPPGAPGAGGTGSVDPGLLDAFRRGARPRVVVELAATADVRRAAAGRRGTRRARAVIEALRATAAASQAEVLRVARSRPGVSATGLWLTNVVVVTGADATLARRLAGLAGVTTVRAERRYPLIEPVPSRMVVPPSPDLPWGIERIGAPEAWEEGITGAGVVVATIDTGVDLSHPALVDRYRGNLGAGGFEHDHNWWDPTGVCGPEPCDNVGHGTHVTGTIVGGDGPGPFTPDIGVAPGARWIAAKGCETLGCTEAALISSGQWVLAPTDRNGGNPDPTRRPDIVSNSWGGGPGDPFYQEVVAAWRAAGIVPVFAAGNPGPVCGQGGSPGDYPESFSVGATDADDMIAEFSGRGPSAFGKVNPDVAAPGVDVVSSVPGGGYDAYDGTSMAAPHVAGALALALSANARLLRDVDGALGLLRITARDRPDLTCGGEEDGDPNNVYGEGRIDAAEAVRLTRTGGTLTGVVRDEHGEPLAGARIRAEREGRVYDAVTGPDGTYRLFLPAGEVELTVDAFGYAPERRITRIETDTTTVEDFRLAPLPRGRVTGTVRSAEDGAPLAGATVRALGTPVPPVRTGLAGRFSLTLPEGTYTLAARSGPCTDRATVEVRVQAGPRPARAEFALSRTIDAAGHGCRRIGFSWVRARHDTALFDSAPSGREGAVWGRLRLPFAFPFYGETHERVWVSRDGFLQFVPPSPEQLWEAFDPSPIPSAAMPNAAVYVLARAMTIGDGTIRYGRIDDAPARRGFVVTWDGVDGRGPVQAQARLWDDGRIDLAYGPDHGRRNDGDGALIGIEDHTGTDALALAVREPHVVEPRSAYRIEPVPTGEVTGLVVDANDGEPLPGATVTAEPGGRRATTGVDGTFRLRLRPGRYTLTTAAARYVADRRPVELRAGETVEVAVRLDAGRPEVTPGSLDVTTAYGTGTEAEVVLRNTGRAPLRWKLTERARSATPIELPPARAAAPPAAATGGAPAAWAAPPRPAERRHAAAPRGIDDLPDVVVEDPDDDATGPVELTAIRAATTLDDGGTLEVALDFTDRSPLTELGGYLMLDLDRDPGTGLRPTELFGKPTQDIGVDAFASLFPVASERMVDLYDAGFTYLGSVPAAVTAGRVRFAAPLGLLGDDDGELDLAAVVGDRRGPTDWAPDVGHGTVEPARDAPWLEVEPIDGTLAADETVRIRVRLGGPDLEPGTYVADLRLATDAPKPERVTVPVTLRVTPPAGWGTLEGRVVDDDGAPLSGVRVVLGGGTADRVTRTDAVGAYRLWAPAGRFTARYTRNGYRTHQETVDVVAGRRRSLDVTLPRLRPRAVVDTRPLDVEVPAGSRRRVQVRVANPGGLVPLRVGTVEVPIPATGSGAGSGRRVAAAAAPGEVLTSFTLPIEAPWGLAVDPAGRLLVADTAGRRNQWFTAAGRPGPAFDTPWATGFPADAAYDPHRRLVWQLDAAGGSVVVGLDPATGAVRATVAGSWSTRQQRGLAYDPVADVFYLGGEVDQEVHRVAGPSWPEPGRLLHSCRPHWVFGNIAGLAWNGTHRLVWVAARGWGNYLAALDPRTCEHRAVVATPEPGFDEVTAGLEMDPLGDLWWVSSRSRTVYLLAAPGHLRTPGEVPWLALRAPAPVAPDATGAVTVTVDATGLRPGTRRAVVVLETNDPDHPRFAVPLRVRVTAASGGVSGRFSRAGRAG